LLPGDTDTHFDGSSSSKDDVIFGQSARLLHNATNSVVVEDTSSSNKSKNLRLLPVEEYLAAKRAASVAADISLVAGSGGSASGSPTSSSISSFQPFSDKFRILPLYDRLRQEGQRVSVLDFIMLQGVHGTASFISVASTTALSGVRACLMATSHRAALAPKTCAFQIELFSEPPVTGTGAPLLYCGDYLTLTHLQAESAVTAYNAGKQQGGSMRHVFLEPLDAAGSADEVSSASVSASQQQQQLKPASVWLIESEDGRGGGVCFGASNRYRLKSLLSGHYLAVAKQPENKVASRPTR
jgi:hypothetical protein